MTAFMIGPDDQDRLRAACVHVRKRPTPWGKIKEGVIKKAHAWSLTLADRESLPEVTREIVNVMLPFGWRVAISCEEQPAGILLHISMNSPADGRVPNPHAMLMLVQTLGHTQDDIASTWIEEYEPGKRAVNMLIMLEERKGGTA